MRRVRWSRMVTDAMFDVMLIIFAFVFFAVMLLPSDRPDPVIMKSFPVWNGEARVCETLIRGDCTRYGNCLVSVCWPAQSGIEYHDPRNVIDVHPAERWLYRRPRVKRAQ